MREVKRIESEVQLLVEGNDQRNFFEALVEHLALDNIQIQDFGGINELRGFLLALAWRPRCAWPSRDTGRRTGGAAD